MTRRAAVPRLTWLYGQSRGLWLTVGLAGPIAVGACAVLPRSIPLLIDGQQRFRLPSVIGLLAVIAISASINGDISEAEWIFRNRIRALKVAHLAVAEVLIVGCAVASAATAVPNRLNVEVLLNGSALLGIALATTALTPLPPWFGCLALVGAMYVVGTDPTTGRPHLWAWLLWPDRLPLKATIDLSLYAAGSVAFVSSHLAAR
jgi:hypothetical protein